MHDAFDVGDTLVFEGPRNAFYLGTRRARRVVRDRRHRRDADPADDAGGTAARNELARSLCRQQPGVHAAAGRGGVGGAGPGHRVGRRRAWPIRHRRRFARRRRADDGGVRVRPDRRCWNRCAPPATSTRTRHCTTSGSARRRSSTASRSSWNSRAPGGCSTFPPNRSALDVMLDDDPTTAIPADRGSAGPARSRCLAGHVDRRGRTAEADGEMLVCVSRANGGRVVIDAARAPAPTATGWSPGSPSGCRKLAHCW